MLQYVQQTASILGFFLVDQVYQSFFQIPLVDFPESVHGIGLGIIQESKQQLPVHGIQAIIIFRITDDITIMFFQILHNEVLVFLFR